MSIIEKIKSLKKPKAPWNKYYSKEERNFKVPNKTIYELLRESANEYVNLMAINYFGTKITFKSFIKEIDKVACSFRSQGIRRGDIVTICMPNTPEALISFYALNKIGAIAEMIHPLSSEVEIKNYLNSTGSVMLVMIDMCYEKIKNIIKETSVYKTVVVSAKDSMPFWIGVGYAFTKGAHILKPSRHGEYMYWKEFVSLSRNYESDFSSLVKPEDPAVILHSGGTTGSPKSIVLSNKNLNALAIQGRLELTYVNPGDTILGVLPLFHGFGLGVTMHCAFCKGVGIVLIPQFSPKTFDKLLIKYKPNIVMGVPTLYEALLNTNNNKLDLSFIKCVVSGGDSMSESLIRKLNNFLENHGTHAKIIQGYGMTEALAAVCVSFKEVSNKEGSIGIPLPGNYLKIVTPNTQNEVPMGMDGEICITGPTVMMGYLDNEKETNEILQLHNDGRIWLHTGDMGYMDNDGVFFYRQRIKRMLITSGYNVYPSQIEQVIESHEAVLNCTVIGIPHPYKIQVAKAFIVLKNGYSDNLFTQNSIKEYCKKHLAVYSVPYEFEFRKSLPKTLIGKVDFKKLQEEESSKNEEK